MTILGDNFVKLVGKISKKKVTKYDNGGVLFKCSLAIPTPPNYEKMQYVGVSVWGDKAERLEELPEGTLLSITGHIEKRSFHTNCKYCNGDTMVYWTDVVIDNYTVVED